MPDSKMTMIDYIWETEEVCLSLIEKRKQFVEPLLTAIKQKEITQIYLLGSGTSCHAGMVLRPFLEEVLNLKVIPMFPLVFLDTENFIDTNSIVIGLSQSGGSVSTMKALTKANDLGLLTVSVSGEYNKEIDKFAKINLYMDCGVEKAVAKTKGYTATLVSLALLGLEIALCRNTISSEKAVQYIERLSKTIQNIPILIKESEAWYLKYQADWEKAERIIVTGYDQQIGTMLEGSLKLLETVRVAVSGYEMEEFMHGVYNAIKENTRLIMLTPHGQYQERALKLADYMRKSTQYCYCIDKKSRNDHDLALTLIDDEFFNVIEYIIPFQVLSYRVSISKGINPNQPSDPEFHKNMGSKIL